MLTLRRTVAALLVAVPLATPLSSQTDPARRVSERLAALQREASDLAAREKTLLTDLRRLEIDRAINAEELATLERELKATEMQIAAAVARAGELRDAAEAALPEVEARLVRLYKMGRAGHWRLLLDVNDAQTLGRAYRMAAAMTRLDRDRVQQHQQTLEAIETERAALEVRAKEYADLNAKAAATRAALDRSMASHTALLRSIDSRQDLAAELTKELSAAQQRLDSALASGRPLQAAVPIRPFRGAIPWPAEGILIGRFGRDRTARGTVTRNGIEISIAEGNRVAAVHEGVVTYAAPFAGYGNLVIVDHGGGNHTLYGHLASLGVNKGDRVEPGTNVGATGRNVAGNPALYFELRIDGKPVDPLQWLRKP